ncbi:MAG: ABC transporter permease [Candidatus Dormibacteraceae bacterium]
MRPRLTVITAGRVLTQLRRDPRTIALMLGVPTILVVLMRYVFNDSRIFDALAPSLICVFPFVMMFVVTSVATLHERTRGTLERLMTMPVARLDLLLGYALAFAIFAAVQVGVVTLVSLTLLGLNVTGSVALLVVIGVLDALLGMALGLFVSAFAATEFQAVQFMPLVAFPQVFLSGLFKPREEMAGVLSGISDGLPLSYAVDAIKLVTASTAVAAQLGRDVGVVAGSIVLALVLGAATLRRRSP